MTYQTGLTHFADFLGPKKQTPDSIIELLTKGKLNVYELLDQFVTHLQQQNIAVASLKLYMATVRSFLEYNDVDIVPSKFKRRVKMPKSYPDPEEPLSLSDIRHLLQFNSNNRLRCYLLLLTSAGLRANEAASLRLKDIDFTVSSTRINIRKEITKTKRGRVVYCSDETTIHLKKLIEYRKNQLTPDSLIFSIQIRTKNSRTIYNNLLHQFEHLQKMADRYQLKENSRRHKITLHSFRRTCFSIINEQTNSEYANWFLGHNHSVYWTHKEPERRSIYATRCMPSLTVLDYSSLDARSKNIEMAMKEKDKAISQLTKQVKDMEEHYKRMEQHQKTQYEILKHLTPEILERIRQS
jgi:integrase